MTETTQNVEPTVEAAYISLPGERLRETREANRMSREEVAHHLHLDVQIIIALEQDNYEKLPSAIYISGYLRAYARLLKLPEAEIVGAYTKGKEINASLIPQNINIFPSKKVVKPSVIKLFALVILVVIAALIFMWLADESDLFGTTKDKEQQLGLATGSQTESVQSSRLTPEAPLSQSTTNEFTSPSPEVDTTSEQTLTPPSAQEIEQKIAQQETNSVDQSVAVDEETTQNNQGDLRLVFNDDSWVEVTDSDDVRYVYQLAKAGAEIYVNGKAPFKVLLGKANAVDVFYKNQSFDHSRYQRDDIAYFRIGKAE